MPNTEKPSVTCEQHHAVLSVTDVRAAVDFYADKLGFVVAFVEGEPPTFASVHFDCTQIFLRKGTPCPESCSVYYVVSNADELFEYHRARGVDIVEPPQDRPFGIREYLVRDRDGYCLHFGHRLPECEP